MHAHSQQPQSLTEAGEFLVPCCSPARCFRTILSHIVQSIELQTHSNDSRACYDAESSSIGSGSW